MALRKFQAGDVVYEVGSAWPGGPENHVVGKIEVVPATVTRSEEREEWSEDEEAENGTEKIAVRSSETSETSQALAERFVAVQMPKELYAFFMDARKHVVDSLNDDLSEQLLYRLKQLLDGYEKKRVTDLVVRHVFAERRAVQQYDDEQPIEAAIRTVLAELGEESRVLREERDARRAAQEKRAQA